jgi:hypothetical protein
VRLAVIDWIIDADVCCTDAVGERAWVLMSE